MSSKFRFSGFFKKMVPLFVVGLLGLSGRVAMADYDTWNGNTSSDWDTASNWYGYYSAGEVPVYQNFDNAIFSSQTANMDVTFSAGGNSPFTVLFNSNGENYTLGSLSSANGFNFQNGRAILIQASLVGHGGTETIDAPIEENGTLYIGNFSPATAPTTPILGVGGYNNALIINNTITGDNNATVYVVGTGNVQLNGDFDQGTNSNGGRLIVDMTAGATTTITGTNNFTGETDFTGNVVIDFTTNNTAKLSTGALVLGYGANEGGGGNLTMIGNGSAASTQSVGNVFLRDGQSSITVNGTNGQTAELDLNGVYEQSHGNGGLINFSTNSTGVITTTDGNNGTNVLGQWATFGKEYWATVVPSSVSGVNLIQGLTTDNGDAFNNNTQDFTVDAAGQVLSGSNEGANTIRFTSGGTLDLGGGTLSMATGGIMVTQDVTSSAAVSSITDGTLSGGNGSFSAINYGAGTLNIGANLSNQNFTKGGSGTVVLSGSSAEVSQSIVIGSGKLVMGSEGALGSNNYLFFGDSTATLDLDGHDLSLNGINSNNDFLPGNQAAANGLNSNITNSAAGTLSRITIQGNANINGGNNDGDNMTYAWNYPVLGFYTGGLNEVSGSIISLNVQQGAASAPVEFVLGLSDPIAGDPTGANSDDASGMTGYSTLITGSITVGANAVLGLEGYSNIQTLGALVVNGAVGPFGQQDDSLGSTYLSGTGSFIYGGNGWNYWLNTTGSVSDTFNGNFGSAAIQTAMSLNLSGTGSATFINPINNYGVATYGTSHLTMNSLIDGTNFYIGGQSSVTITGTSGTVAGGNIQLQNGTLTIAPAGSGADVSVNSVGNNMNYNGDAAIILDRGQNSSLTFTFGSTGGTSLHGGDQDATLIIGSAQGLAALGNTDKFVILGSTNIGQQNGIAVQSYNTNDQSHHSIFGVDFSSGGTQAATFLTYVGTGTASDQGFTAYSFAVGNTNNINASGQGSVELVNDTSEVLGQNTAVGNLELDGGKLDTGTSVLVTEDDYSATSSIIFNKGASIVGAGVYENSATTYYTDLTNASISTLNANRNDIVKAGAGTLTVGSLTSVGNVIVNGGALDLGTGVESVAANGYLILHGGVLQGSGTYTATFGYYYGTNQIAFDVDNDYSNSLGGGFSARGGELNVTLYDLVTGNNLSWGGTAFFLPEGGVLDFGSTTSDAAVFFNDNLDLGPVGNSNSLYGRVIDVTGNSADAGIDPLNVTDYTVMTGNITANTNSYVGLEKDGTGVLYLEGANTYTGATVIAKGTLGIFADNSLGAAPAAAYAQNTTPGLVGDALTPGAVQINGGATLAAYNDVVLNSNRQILLASGTTGSTPSNIDVAAGSTLSFGGLIGDYVGEVGSLNKEGVGTFQYSGVSANTGTDSVSGGTFAVTGAGSVNSVSGIVLNNATSTSAAEFNYSSSTALTRSVTFAVGANGSFGGGTFAYNSSAAFTGGPLNVINHGVLSGSGNLGTTAVTIGATGTITPGQIDPTPGTLTQGATTFLTGGNYNFLVVDATGAAGTGYSTVNATSLDISSLGTFTINLESLNGSAPGDAANFDPTQSYSFVLVDAADGITGTFDPSQFIVMTSANNGATGFSNAFTGTWTVSESGDDLLLDYTAAAVPEPSTYALMGLGLLALVVINRWRKRNV